MRIHLYATAWNEERMIPFFLRHYEPLVDRMIIFDDGSDDGSRELLTACSKVEVRPMQRTGSFLTDQTAALRGICREARGRADWILVVDIDEHLFHADLRGYLRRQRKKGITACRATGYDMMTETFPEGSGPLCRTLTRGRRFPLLDKTAIFDPNQIDLIKYHPGKHTCALRGRVAVAEGEVALLHYKNLGVEYLLQRSREMHSRHTDSDYARGWGVHYQRSEAQIREEFDRFSAAAEELDFLREGEPEAKAAAGAKSWWGRILAR